jgi:hypothetical protein
MSEIEAKERYHNRVKSTKAVGEAVEAYYKKGS